MRSYLVGGSSTVLLLGRGTLVFACGSFVASWLPGYEELNAYMTVVNLSAMVSFAFHAAGALANIKGLPPEADPRLRRKKLLAGYTGALVLAALIALATVTAALPPFYARGEGPTDVRQTVLMIALILFAITSTSMMICFIKQRAHFLYWYSLALALLALTMGGAFFQLALGTVMGMLARVPLYLSGVYFIMAIISASREARTQNVSLDRSIAELFHKSERKISFILASITDGHYELDRDRRFVRINNQALAYFGRKREDLVGRLHPDVFPTVKGSIFEEQYKKVFSDADAVHFETQSVLCPGKRVEVHAYPTEGGGISVFFRDITERKNGEEALRQSEERFKLSMEATNDGLWDWDIETDEAYFSPAYFRMLGYEPGDFPGKGNSWKELMHLDDREHVLQANLECIEGCCEHFEIEFRMKAKDGSWRWILGRGKCVARDEQGRALRLVGTHVDITDRKRAEEKVRASLREKEVLLKEIHHRVKNNLQIISSLLYLQSTRTEHTGAATALSESQARIRSMALIHERVYSSPDLASVEMGRYTRNLVSDLLRSHMAEDGLVRLRLDLEDISLGMTEAIPCGLIINELVSNALKHAFPEGKQGEITIGLRRMGTSRITLTVSDNGIGFPDHVDFRNSPSLGLTLVKSLAEQLGGTIELDRTDATLFTITFN